MISTDALESRFGIGTQLSFKQYPEGILVAQVDNSFATATISLHGGHVVAWRPRHQVAPVLWVSKLAKFTPGKAIRGGVPICWPWFGAHPTDAKLPGHGYARLSLWELVSARTLGGGATEIILTLHDANLRRAHWPHPVRLSVRITVGDTLEVALTTTNDGGQKIVLSEGFHTYFQIGDIADIRVYGLEGCGYIDLVNGNLGRQQTAPIVFDGEFGRIYPNTEATCVIEDPSLRRRIRIQKAGSFSTAIWNPWAERAAMMDDIGQNGWRDMVCVESANALENSVTVDAGASRTISSVYSVENISRSD